MIKLRTFALLLLLTSSSIFLIYLRPPSEVNVLPTQPTEVLLHMETSSFRISPQSDTTYSVTIYMTGDEADPILNQTGLTGDFQGDLGDSGMYIFEIRSSNIASFLIKSTGIPDLLWIYLGLIFFFVIVLYRRQILYRIT